MATTTKPEVETVSSSPSRSAAVATPASARPGGKRRVAFLIMGVVLLGLLAVGARRWWLGRTHVSTDHAQVDGHIIPILPKVGGFVLRVRVIENQHVTAGDTLVVLDDRDYSVRLTQATADLAVALAGVSNRARVDRRRRRWSRRRPTPQRRMPISTGSGPSRRRRS